MNYREAIDYLNTFQFHGYRLGLDRMKRALLYFGNPHEKLKFIHVAGTNGKGSVCATLSSILTSHGYKTGLYTSPHLIRLNERFRFCEQDISDYEIVFLIKDIKDLIELGYELSFFEITTLMAILWFFYKGCDICVLETGLGGRLDATNVVIPLICIITSISMDHRKYLGNDIKSIAFEKAGIIKSNVPVISGVKNRYAFEVIRDKALNTCSSVRQIDRDFSVKFNNGLCMYYGWNTNISDIDYRLKGRHQMDNLALAVAGVEILRELGIYIMDDSVRKGCREVNWPCRCEVLKERFTIVLDGAHNIDGVLSFRDFLKSIIHDYKDSDKILLWACSDDGGDEMGNGKEIGDMLMTLLPFFDKVYITEPPDTRNPVTIERWKKELRIPHVIFDKNYRNLFLNLYETVKDNSLLCACGSLYLVGKIREFLINKD